MSLVYHPDKNQDDPLAASRFMQITRAHAALTDETAKRNYEKYGNPDGPQTTKVGIGLPRRHTRHGGNRTERSDMFRRRRSPQRVTARVSMNGGQSTGSVPMCPRFSQGTRGILRFVPRPTWIAQPKPQS